MIKKSILIDGIKKYISPKATINKLEVIPDPEVPGTLAIRAHIKLGKKDNLYDFLLCHSKEDKNSDWVMENLEDVEFTEWPPTSGNLKFY